MSYLNNSAADRPRLQVLTDMGDITALEFDLAASLAALATGDALALHGLDPEFAPFWCSRCQACYCGRHWTTWVLMDEGFFDEKRGRCPSGHERLIYD